MIELRVLLKHLHMNGCQQLREGSKHSIWINTQTDRRTAVPRHRLIPRTTAQAICKQLGIPTI